MQYVKAKPISLNASATHNEHWLESRIKDDPGLLGLGDVEVKETQRRQPSAGRLDLLLSNLETRMRYEVEIQLGATDERHIIRTIEYWDIEKSRYPQYDHVAVLAAEDITSRFLNVISLFNKAIPLIAIQIRALEVGDALTLHATTVLDLASLGTDEEDEAGPPTDRAYWLQKASEASISIADQLLSLVNDVQPGMSLKYTKHYIGLARDDVSDNFLILYPKKKNLGANFRIPESDELTALIEDSGMDTGPYDKRDRRYRLRLTTDDVSGQKALLLDLIRRASDTPPPIED